MSIRKRETQRDGRSISDQNAGVMFTPSEDELREMIAKRAFNLYEERDAGCGDEQTDWLRAEQEVIAMLMELPGIDNVEAPAPGPSVGAKSGGRKVTKTRSARTSLPLKRNRKMKDIPA